MESYLRKAGQTVALIDAADLASASKVRYYFFTLSEKQLQPVSSTAAHTAAAAAAAAVHINIHPDASADEDSSRVRTVLRSDAAEVLADSAALARLATFKALTGGGADTDALRAQVDEETMSSLHRLSTSGEDLAKNLAGAQRPLPSSRGLRSAIMYVHACTCVHEVARARAARVLLAWCMMARGPCGCAGGLAAGTVRAVTSHEPTARPGSHHVCARMHMSAQCPGRLGACRARSLGMIHDGARPPKARREVDSRPAPSAP